MFLSRSHPRAVSQIQRAAAIGPFLQKICGPKARRLCGEQVTCQKTTFRLSFEQVTCSRATGRVENQQATCSKATGRVENEQVTCLEATFRLFAQQREVFKKHPCIAKVRVFGSRAKGNFRRESDVDLAIYGDVDAVLASLVASELDELPLPYQFDVQAYPCIKHAPLREHINRVSQSFFVSGSSTQELPG
jgi:uncharacterized protein